MIRFIHTSDLHLKESEKEYSLSVLREIVEKAESKNCHFILICGDIFDRFKEIEPLKAEVGKIFDGFSGEIFAIQGNHEELECPTNADPYSASVGKVQFASFKKPKIFLPKDLTLKDQVEIHALPFYKEFPYDQLIRKKPDSKILRIAMAHGSEPSLVTYLGPSPEEADSIIESQPFQEAGYNYLALGHIHTQNFKKIGSFSYAYSGSPRVVRAGEFGAKSILNLEWSKETGLISEPLILSSAGQYREIPVQVSLAGDVSIPETIRNIVQPQDLVRLIISGVCENEGKVLESCQKLKETIQCRGFSDTGPNLKVLAHIIENPMAKLFLDKVTERQLNNKELDVDWNHVIQVGLTALGDSK